MSEQMRAAWRRRTKSELLRACFVEELSPAGRRVVTELVTEELGPIDELVARFAAEQGDVVVRRRVRRCHVASQVKERRLPPMRGVLVLATRGIGFLPAGRDDDVAIRRGVGGVLNAIVNQMKETSEPIDNVSKSSLPVPLLANIVPGAVWLPQGSFDALSWSSSGGTIDRRGERLVALATPVDCLASVATWAAAHHVPLQRVASSTLLETIGS